MIAEDILIDPFQRTKGQQIAIVNVARGSGSISFISSSVTIYMILISEIKLGTPFRRIIFAMCVTDLLQSGCCIISTLTSPKDTPGIWGAMGNELSCYITGFIFQFSSTAASLYMVSLMLHYYYFVKHNITEKDFRQREPWLHAVPTVFGLVDASILWAQNNLNQADVVCWIASVPYNCINEPDIECIRGEDSHKWRWILAAAPNASALFIIFILGVEIFKVVRRREKEEKLKDNEHHNQEYQARVLEERLSSPARKNGPLSLSPRRPIPPTMLGAQTSKREKHDEEEVPHLDNMINSSPKNFRGIGTSCSSVGDLQAMEDRNHMKIDLSTGALVHINDHYEDNLLLQRQHQVPPRRVQDEEGQGDQSSLWNQRLHFASTEGDNAGNSDDKENLNGQDLSKTNRKTLESGKDRERKKKDKILGFRYNEVVKQALLYLACFLYCYSGVYLNAIFEAIPDQESPYPIRLLLWATFPSQGFWNIFVFIRPHVIAFRKHEKDVSIFAAAWKVIKSGTDVVSKEAVNRRNVARLALHRRSTMKRNGAHHRHDVLSNEQQEEKDDNDRTRSEGDSSNAVVPERPVAEVVHDENAHNMDALSSIGDFVSSKGDEAYQEQDDYAMYGDNDYDIYDDDGLLSYADEELLRFYDDLDNDDKISFGPDYEDEEQEGH